MTHPVIAGLDPAIHHFGIEIVFTMDARVKPAHDESGFVKLGITRTLSVMEKLNPDFVSRAIAQLAIKPKYAAVAKRAMERAREILLAVK